MHAGGVDLGPADEGAEAGVEAEGVGVGAGLPAPPGSPWCVVEVAVLLPDSAASSAAWAATRSAWATVTAA